jgi:hypothetical protein
MDMLLSTSAKSDKELARNLKALLAERISPLIAGDVVSVPLVACDVAAYVACPTAAGSTESCKDAKLLMHSLYVFLDDLMF